MPYKDKNKQKAAQHQYYLLNKKECIDRSTSRRRALKEWFKEITKNDKCSFCPEDDPCTIDYHHKEPGHKDKGISELLSQIRSKERILKELKKCIPVCSNCHRKIHAGKIIV